ncbi:AMP-binding protein [Desulfovibrio sp. OttesenSCG-928-C14]|nr:AMP-binding protein [Desulfovibrio sp. OttesenSCG-928-C14]
MNEFSLPALTLRQILENGSCRYGDAPALSMLGGQPFSYQDLYEHTSALSRRLILEGIGFGDKVAILAENSPHWGIAYFAVTGMGAVAVPILTEFHAEAVAHIIRHSEAKAIFVSEKFFPKLKDAVFEPDPLFISMESFGQLSRADLQNAGSSPKSRGLDDFNEWRQKNEPGFGRIAEPGEEDLASIIYTSGTTGHSKGVMLTHGNIVSNAASIHDIVELDHTDRMLSILPLPHTFECTLGLALPLLRGTHVHYLDKAPTARALLPALAQVRPTAFLTVPLVMEKIYKASVLPKFSGNSVLRLLYRIPPLRRIFHRAAGKKLLAAFGGALKVMAIGGAPMAGDVEVFLREAGFPFTVGYGLTEASPLLSGVGPLYARQASAGKAIRDTSLRLGRINPLSGEGEIEAKGPGIMRGYYKMPEQTKEAFTEDGWLKTGDLAAMDSDGFIYIKGRTKNVILGPSGENIYPEEVESLFFTSPYVLDVLVHQDDGRLTARVHLDSDKIGELVTGLSESEMMKKLRELLEELRQHVNSKASPFARIMRIYEQKEPFEKTATQKIKRYLYVNTCALRKE